MWSNPMPVTAAATVSTALVASQRPPRPTSRTAASTPASANIAMAAAVSSSNSVHPCAQTASPRACRRSHAARAQPIPREKAASVTGAPPTSTRSV